MLVCCIIHRHDQIPPLTRYLFVAAAILSGVLLNFAGIHLMYGLVLAGAIVAAGVELLPLRVNDNLVIPVVSGGVMEVISRLTGCA